MDECRICRGFASDGELFHPCKCTGSIKYVHQDCLQEWLDSSLRERLDQVDKRKCELCGWTYQFTPVYGPIGEGVQLQSYAWYGWTLMRVYVHKGSLLIRGLTITSLTALVMGYMYVLFTAYGDLMAHSFLRKFGLTADFKLPHIMHLFDHTTRLASFGNHLASGLVLLGITMIFLLALWMVSLWTLQDRILLLENKHILDHGEEWGGSVQLRENIEVADRIALRAVVERELGAAEAEDFVDLMMDNEVELEFDDQEEWFWPFMTSIFGMGLIEQLQNTCLFFAVMVTLMGFLYLGPYMFGVLNYSLVAPYLSLPPPNTLELRIVCFLIGSQQIALCCMAPYLVLFKFFAPYEFGRQLICIANQLASIEKVFFVVLMEAVIFPLFCGVLVHISLLPIVEDTPFVATFLGYPRFHFGLWWSIGMFYMFTLSDFFRNCRSFFRPGVLYFIQDPSDPRNEPIRHFLASSLWTHFKKIAFSAVIYLGLLLGCVGGVAKAIALLSLIRPLCIKWPEHDVIRLWPFMILFVYLIVSKKVVSQLSSISKAVFEREFRRVAGWLNLGSFLFGELPQPGSGTFVRAPDEDSPFTRKNARLFAQVSPQDELLDEPPSGLVELKTYTLVWRPSYFWLRVVTLLAWILMVSTVLCVSIALVPLLLAREYSASLLPSVRTDYSLYIVGFCWCAAAAYNARRITTAKEAARLVLCALLRGNFVYLVSPAHPASPLLSSVIYGWCTFVPNPPQLTGFSLIEYASICCVLLPHRLALASQLAFMAVALLQPSAWKERAIKAYNKVGDRLENVGA